MQTRVDSTTTRHEITMVVIVTGAEPRQVPYSRQGSTYLPEVASLRYTRQGAQGWRTDVTLSGPRLNKDGRPSLNSAREHLGNYGSGLPEHTPDWVVQLAAENHPQP